MSQKDVVELDVRGLLCPLPVIRVQERVSTMAAGQGLLVTASDPGAAHDIPAWCRVHDHLVESCHVDEEGGVTIMLEVGCG